MLGLILVILPEESLTIWQVSYAPNGERALLRASTGGRAVLAEYADGQFRILREMRGPTVAFMGLDWSPSGLALIVARDSGGNSLLLYDGISLVARSHIIPLEVTVFAVRWAPDSTRALILGTAHSVYVFDRADDTLALANRSIGLGFGSFLAADWRYDGDEALVVGDGVGRLDPRTNNLSVPPADAEGARLFDVGYAPNSGEALMIGEGGKVFAYNGSFIRQVATIPSSRPGFEILLEDVAWHPDGDWALLAGTERDRPPTHSERETSYGEVVASYNRTTGLEILSSTGGDRVFRQSPGTSPAQARWGADGSEAFVTSGEVLFRVSAGSVRLISSLDNLLFALDSHPAAKEVIIGGAMSRIYRYDGISLVDLSSQFHTNVGT